MGSRCTKCGARLTQFAEMEETNAPRKGRLVYDPALPATKGVGHVPSPLCISCRFPKPRLVSTLGQVTDFVLRAFGR